jgi:hypothetical protein
MKQKPTQEELKACFEYEDETGSLIWKVMLNYRGRVGTVAGCQLKGKHKYQRIGFKNSQYFAHHLIWVYHHGYWPPNFIDHIDGDQSNNRIGNLRPATATQNAWNRAEQSNNTSGRKGVHWDQSRGLWMAFIHENGRFKNLGRFTTKEEAAEVQSAASKRLCGEFHRD